MKVTLSIDDVVLVRARKLAARRGTSLNQLVRDYLEELTVDMAPEEIVRDLTGCRRLYSEDLQSGFRIENLEVINPFRS